MPQDPTDPTDPTGAVVRNLLDLQRLGNGLSREARALLRALFDDIVAEMARLDPTSVQERYRGGRIRRIVEEIERLTGESFGAFHKATRQGLAAVGAQQGLWAADQLQRAIGAVGVDIKRGGVGINRLKAILDSQPFQGETLKGWADTQRAATVRRVRRQLQLGAAQNETLGSIIRRVRGRSNGRGGFTGGVLKTTTKEAEAIVRTGLNFVANEAHMATYRANSDITQAFEYTATLDSRVTIICASLDGRIFRYDDPERRVPPQHFRCRSVAIPVIDWESLGIDPPAPGQRASADGPVKSSTTYEQWLRDQPKGVQNEVLGPVRAKMFRGGASLREMVTTDNRIVTVAELGARDVGGIVRGADGVDLDALPTFGRAVEEGRWSATRGGPRGDQAIWEVADAQGFTGPPEVVSAKELDGFVAKGERELWRGVGSHKRTEAFKNGELYIGPGMNGSGTYTVGTGQAVGAALGYGPSLARAYAGSGGAVMRMSLRVDARTIGQRALFDERRAYFRAREAEVGGIADAAARARAARRLAAEEHLLGDLGAFAMFRGYDAIIVDLADDFVVVLNRTAVRVQREIE